MKHIGTQTVCLESSVGVSHGAAVGGKKEADGPLKQRFDALNTDAYWGQKSWEAAESAMLGTCFELLCRKSKIVPQELQFLLSGDLQSQCTASAFALRNTAVPYLGIYGACSNMGEAMSIGAMLIAGSAADKVCAITCSHFCTAERQFRLPLEYGGQRTPTAQRTATAAGAVLLTSDRKVSPRITYVTTGQIVDAGVTDANNMGAAMAPAAWDTLRAHFRDTGRTPADYDAVITGDLGHFGHAVLADLAHAEGYTFPNIFTDCGMRLYDAPRQDLHAGGSGCGCSASVFAGHILRCLQERSWNRILFAPTGALLSLTSTQQGESIPGICHALAIENTEV